MGLVPFFSKDGKRSFTTFNARGEELRSKPMYREPFKTRRCVVPANEDVLVSRRVSKAVANVKNNGPELLA
jgi:putative SOS response-associated peptidase YedK